MKKRIISAFLTLAMLCSLLPGTALAVEGERAAPFIHMGDTMLVDNGSVAEGAVLPDGMSFYHDTARGIYVLTLENVRLDHTLYLDSDDRMPPAQVEIVLKGENIIDTRQQEDHRREVLSFYHCDPTFRSADENSSLTLYSTDSVGITSNNGLLTFDGANVVIRSEWDQDMEASCGFNGGADILVTGGSNLDVFGGWIGFLQSGSVTFEDCTVTTNRIHVHSHVDEDEFGNLTTDQRTMTVGQGAVLNVVSQEDNPDSVLMLLDGSTLKIDGGVLNCDFRVAYEYSNRIQVGYNGDCAVNTLLLESGEVNITGTTDIQMVAVALETGRLIQNGGTMTFNNVWQGIEAQDNSSCQINGGKMVFDNCWNGIYTIGTTEEAAADKFSMTGGDVSGTLARTGLVVEEGRASISGGTMSWNVGTEDVVGETGVLICDRLIVSGGELISSSSDMGMVVDTGGRFILQGGTVRSEGQKLVGLLSYGLTDLRGGSLELKGDLNAHESSLTSGAALYLGENMFLKTPGAAQATMVEGEEVLLYYADSNGDHCKQLSFGTTGGAFAGQLDVDGTELSVGVPFVVSADLALGEKSGTALFRLPEGLSVKGQASVNGKAVNSVYDAGANTLTVPIQSAGASLRFYAVADRTMDESTITCAVQVESGTHELSSPAFTVDGLRMTLPGSVSMPNLTVDGSGAPGGLVKVYEVSQKDAPLLLNGEGFPVNALGDFYGSVELPAIPEGETTHTYPIRVELLDADGNTLIDADTWNVNYTTHATTLRYLNIRNDYHGASLTDILTNDIWINYTDDLVSINGSTKERAYNYFPEYPTFYFSAGFDETENIISVILEAKGKKGQTINFPMRYNSENDCFEGWCDFPDWAPEFFSVSWIEEGVVNRESACQGAIDQLQAITSAPDFYNSILDQTIDQVSAQVEDYFDRVTVKKVSDSRYEYYDEDEELIYAEELEVLPYEPGMETGPDFQALGQSGKAYIKTASDLDSYSLTTTLVLLGETPQVYRHTGYISYVELGAPSPLARAATPGQRSTVFVLKQIPRVGDAVLAVDSRLLYDSLLDFDSIFSDDIADFTRVIGTTMTYRCPYTGQEIPRALTPEAAEILQELLDLQQEYAQDYNKNKEAIREDMKAALMGGVTLGVNKFCNKKTQKAWEVLNELKDQYEDITGDLQDLEDFLNDPQGAMQAEWDELMTPEGLVAAAAEQGYIDEDTKELLDTLMDPDGTYQDAQEFMVEYQDRLTELRDRYTELLRKEMNNNIAGGNSGGDCEPPTDDTPPLPNTAGGEEIPVPAIKDPSGYVYEGVESNRLSGVTTTLYYGGEGDTPPAQNADQLGLEPWEAQAYRQSNPLTTDALGQYQWMVPDGWWQVKYEKQGYQTLYSDWLPVPPPQTEVNVGMVSTAQPQVDIVAPGDSFILEFDRYLLVDSMETELTIGGQPIYSRLTPLNTALAPDGETQLASRFRMDFRRWELTQMCYGELRITEATTYAGVELDRQLSQTVTLSPYIPAECYWEEDTCTVWLIEELDETILPFAAGYREGMMTDCIPLTTEGVALTGDTVKVFFLDKETLAPLYQVTVW